MNMLSQLNMIGFKLRRPINKNRPSNKNVEQLMWNIVKISGLLQDLPPASLLLLNAVTFSFLTLITLMIIGVYTNSGNMANAFEAFSLITFCMMAALKLASLRRYSQHWRNLVREMTALEKEQLADNSDPMEYETDEEDHPSSNKNKFAPHIEKYTMNFKSVSSVLAVIYLFTVTMFIATPFIQYGFLSLNGHKLDYPHLMPIWFPIDNVSVYGHCVIVVLLEIIPAIFCVVTHSVFDITFIGMVTFICGQFSLLKDYSADIGGSGGYAISQDRERRAHSRIIKCKEIHMFLTDMIRNLNNLTKNILGVYFVIAVMTVCSIAVRLSLEELGVMETLSLIQYMNGVLIQLFLFCFYGDKIFHESSVGPGEGLFAAALWGLSPRTRKEMHLLSVGMVKGHSLHAGPFNTLNLPSFVLIIRSAYSYYAILNK